MKKLQNYKMLQFSMSRIQLFQGHLKCVLPIAAVGKVVAGGQEGRGAGDRGGNVGQVVREDSVPQNTPIWQS